MRHGNCGQDCCEHGLLHEILEKVNNLGETIMANQADLQAVVDAIVTKVNSLGDDLTKLSTDFSTLLAALQAQIGGGNPVDLQPQIDALNAIGTKLDTVAASLVSLDATEVSDTPTPPAA